MKRWLLIVVVFILIILLWSRMSVQLGKGKMTIPFFPNTKSEPTAESVNSPTPYIVETVTTGLSVPWSIVFPTPSRMLVAERNGSIRIVENAKLLAEPLATFDGVSQQSEDGLMGLAIDPEYAQNRRIYACYAHEVAGQLVDRVVAATDEGDALSNIDVLLDNIPAAQYHAGCRLAFGPDKKLYITTGDATRADIAQDMKSLGGKILRMNTDGSIPADNPSSSSPIWSAGHRNAQGLAWHPITQALLSTEHGPSGFDGPGGGDEINQIQKGSNYGWPLVSHDRRLQGYVDPLITYTPAVAPSGATFYSSDVMAQYQNRFFFAALKGEALYMLTLSARAPHRVIASEKVVEGYGRIREVIEGPDGYLYFTTSNRDGRGNPALGDDRIMRIRPE